MKVALDTNVLVYAHMPGVPEHPAVAAAVAARLENPDVVLVVTPMVLHEFVHVVTDPRRFDPPLSMAEAIAVANLYLEHSNVECAAVDGAATAQALAWMRRHNLGRKRVADALIAAAFALHGVDELLTCNASDFAVFGKPRAIDPRG